MFDRSANSSRSAGVSHPDADGSGTIPFVPVEGRIGTVSFSGPAAFSTPHDQHLQTAANFPAVPGYQIVRALGTGGMGNVYQAFEPKFNRWVALKLLRDSYHKGDTVEKRFAAEADLLARLDHRNVVRVYAVGEFEGRPYFAMRYVPGGALDGRLAEFRVTAGHAVRLLVQLARAVQYLHDRGVWHRDLKPQNVLLDDDGEPLVADFGVAKFVEGESYTVGSACVGTYAYMAPEMIRYGSVRANAGADVWSLGVMLFELLAGVRPFPGRGDDPHLIRRIEHDPPQPLARPGAAPGIDEGLERIVLKALAKDPCHRYQSAEALAADLEGWLGTGTVSDAPPLADARRHAAQSDAGTTAPARRRTRWRVAVPTAILVAVAFFALAWSQGRSPETPPTPKPPPAPAPTFQDVWTRDGDVTVIDSEGKLRFPLNPIPGSIPGVVGTDRDAAGKTVFGNPLALYEISSLPPPYRFSAKVRHTWGEVGSRVGLYVRRLATPNGNGGQHQFFALALDTTPAVKNRRGTLAYGAVQLDLAKRPVAEEVAARLLEHPLARHPAEPGDAHDIALDVTAEGVTTFSGGAAFDPVKWTLAESALDIQRLIKPAVNLGPPQLGDGLGLFVFRGTATVRDVRVTRPR